MAYDQSLYDDYKKIPLHSSKAEVYDHLKETYELYCQIGGYPKVVENYLENQSIVKAQGELVKIIDTFKMCIRDRCYTYYVLIICVIRKGYTHAV